MDETNSSYHFFRFIEYDGYEKYSKFTGNSNGMFIIESDGMKVGGLVRWDNQYKLRHLTLNYCFHINKIYRTNYYLAVGKLAN